MLRGMDNAIATVTNSRSQAISTRYLGPTNHRDSRIVAQSEGGRKLTVSYDYALNQADNHAAACRALLAELGWSGQWVSGATPTGYVFVDCSTASAAAYEDAAQICEERRDGGPSNQEARNAAQMCAHHIRAAGASK